MTSTEWNRSISNQANPKRKDLIAAVRRNEPIFVDGSVVVSVHADRHPSIHATPWRSCMGRPLPRKPESSLVRFPAIQGIKGEENLADLAPQRGLVPTEAVKCEVGQIGKTQIAMR
jgi:hypothetical protein